MKKMSLNRVNFLCVLRKKILPKPPKLPKPLLLFLYRWICFPFDIIRSMVYDTWSRKKHDRLLFQDKNGQNKVISLLVADSDMLIMFIDRFSGNMITKSAKEVIYIIEKGKVIDRKSAFDYYASRSKTGEIKKVSRTEANKLTTTPAY